VIETRKRVKAEFAALSQSEIETAARNGTRDGLLEEVTHVLFAHSGDAMPIDPALVANADLLVHDATFLNEPDRREPIHATTEEALDVAKRADVKSLVLNHLSIRYDRATAIPALRAQVASSGFIGECWLLDDDAWVPLR
jgi:ribonuclease Z